MINTGFMVSTRDVANSHKLLTKFLHEQNYIRHRFKPTSIIIQRSMRWVTIVVPQNLYSPVKQFIRKYLCGQYRPHYWKTKN